MHHRLIPLTACAAAFVSFAAVAQVRAVEIISNLDGNDSFGSVSLSDQRVKGMAFTMPADAGYTLDAATLRLAFTDQTTVTPVVQLWADAGGVPTTLLTTLDNPDAFATGTANYDFAGNGFDLLAGTKYWLLAYGDAAGTGYTWQGSSPTVLPTGIATHSGSSFGTAGPPPATATSIVLNSYALDATPVAVPEPASLGLLAAGGTLLLRRRRRA